MTNYFVAIKESEEFKTTQYPMPVEKTTKKPELVVFNKFPDAEDNIRQSAMFATMDEIGVTVGPNIAQTPNGDFWRIIIPLTEQDPHQYATDLLGDGLTFWWPSPKKEGEPEYKQATVKKERKKKNEMLFSSN